MAIATVRRSRGDGEAAVQVERLPWLSRRGNGPRHAGAISAEVSVCCEGLAASAIDGGGWGAAALDGAAVRSGLNALPERGEDLGARRACLWPAVAKRAHVRDRGGSGRHRLRGREIDRYGRRRRRCEAWKQRKGNTRPERRPQEKHHLHVLPDRLALAFLSFALARPTENHVRRFNQIVGKFAEKLSKILMKHKPWTNEQVTAVLRRCAFRQPAIHHDAEMKRLAAFSARAAEVQPPRGPMSLAFA